MVRLACFSDIDYLKNLTDACTEHMISNKIFQWNITYPSKIDFEKDIKNQELYVKEINDSIISCVMFSKSKDDCYNKVNWLTSDSKNLYVHRLAVHPKYQKNGIGKLMMDFAENEGTKMGCVSVRLDTFSKNLRNLKFYLSRGYFQLDEIYFPKQSKYPFYCFEKVLKE